MQWKTLQEIINRSWHELKAYNICQMNYKHSEPSETDHKTLQQKKSMKITTKYD